MKKLFSFFTLVFLQFNCIKSNCVLNIASDSNAPDFEVPIGNSRMSVYDNIRLNNGDVIEAHCEFGFNTVHFYYDYVDIRQSSIQIKCDGNDLYYKSYRIYSDTKFTCKTPQTILYENILPWCDTNVKGYTLYLDDHKFAGLCYNLTGAEFHSIYYSALHKNKKMLTIQTPTKMQSIGEETKIKVHYSYLLDNYIRNKHTELQQKLQQSSEWMKHVKFEIGSIFAGEKYENLLSTSMLDVLWWPNLRDGNWKRLIEAFEIQSIDKDYDIWRGLSGSLYIPDQKECVKDLSNATIPVYIWNYFKGRDNDDELLVVAYNSPFYEFLSENEVIFCEDVCHKYPWLNSARTSFRYGSFGIMFCCDINDVNVKHFLNNFSYNILADDSTNTTTDSVTTGIESTSAFETNNE